MRVKTAIEMLQKLNPDEEIIIDWWDRSIYNRLINEDAPTEKFNLPEIDAWKKVVSEWDVWEENHLLEEIWGWIHDALMEYGAWND